MRLWDFDKRFEPIRTLEWVLVASSLVQGIYVYSPLYQYSVAVNGATPFAAALAHPAGIFIWISLIVITGLMVGWGLWKKKPKYRSMGLFGQGLLRFYNVLTTIIVVGFLPLTWIYALIVVVFCFVLWLNARIEVRRDAAP